jgi:hypothetical protein
LVGGSGMMTPVGDSLPQALAAATSAMPTIRLN